jgi:hypothetical protein
MKSLTLNGKKYIRYSPNAQERKAIIHGGIGEFNYPLLQSYETGIGQYPIFLKVEGSNTKIMDQRYGDYFQDVNAYVEKHSPIHAGDYLYIGEKVRERSKVFYSQGSVPYPMGDVVEVQYADGTIVSFVDGVYWPESSGSFDDETVEWGKWVGSKASEAKYSYAFYVVERVSVFRGTDGYVFKISVTPVDRPEGWER